MLNEQHSNPVQHTILIEPTFLYMRESIYDHMWDTLQSVNMAKYQNSLLPWSTFPIISSCKLGFVIDQYVWKLELPDNSILSGEEAGRQWAKSRQN